jgi:hypothetical protein
MYQTEIIDVNPNKKKSLITSFRVKYAAFVAGATGLVANAVDVFWNGIEDGAYKNITLSILSGGVAMMGYAGIKSTEGADQRRNYRPLRTFGVGSAALGLILSGHAFDVFGGDSKPAGSESGTTIAAPGTDATNNLGQPTETTVVLSTIDGQNNCEIITPISGNGPVAVDSMKRLQAALNIAGFNAGPVTGAQKDITPGSLEAFKQSVGMSGRFDLAMCVALDGLVGGVLTDGDPSTPSIN